MPGHSNDLPPKQKAKILALPAEEINAAVTEARQKAIKAEQKKAVKNLVVVRTVDLHHDRDQLERMGDGTLDVVEALPSQIDVSTVEKKLKPGGILVVYCERDKIAAVMEQVDGYLEYYWAFTVREEGGGYDLRLAFAKPPAWDFYLRRWGRKILSNDDLIQKLSEALSHDDKRAVGDEPDGEAPEGEAPEGDEAAVEKSYFGFGQWCDDTFNCFTGCEHNCKCCGSCGTAIRFGREIADHWGDMVPREGAIEGTLAVPSNKTIAFPSAHDFTPGNMDLCFKYGHRLLDNGCRWLWTTKPHMEVVKRFCQEFAAYKDRITTRFTITSFDDAKSRFWETNAPLPEVRLDCLKFAADAGFVTSVSAEPMLDAPRITDLFSRVAPWTTESVWVGPMNRPRSCNRKWRGFDAEIKALLAEQTPVKLRVIYDDLKDQPKVMWKDSFIKKMGPR